MYLLMEFFPTLFLSTYLKFDRLSYLSVTSCVFRVLQDVVEDHLHVPVFILSFVLSFSCFYYLLDLHTFFLPSFLRSIHLSFFLL